MTTVLRELHEELDLSLDAGDLQHLGCFQAQAANEPGHQVQAEVYVGRLVQNVSVQAEIDASDWIDLECHDSAGLAPLLSEKVMPALRRHLVLQVL